METSRKKITALVLLCPILFGKLKAEEHAQEERDTIQLEEIEVIGEKLSQDDINTNVHSVSITTAADIEDSTILDLRDIFSRTANIQEDFNIRGIGAFSIAGGSLAASPLVGMYVDGAVQSTFGLRNGALELWDVEQVSVYRGAQSINLGRSSLAGGIAIKTKNPTFDWTLDTRTQYASYNTLIASAAGGGPIVEDQLAFRLAFDFQTTDGFVENPTIGTERANDNGNTLIRGKLLFEPHALPGLSVLASASYSKNREGDDLVTISKGDGDVAILKGKLVVDDPISPFEHKIFSNHPGFEDVNTLVSTLDLTYELATSWKIHSVSTLVKDDYSRQDDADRLPNAQNVVAAILPRKEIRLRNNETFTFTQDLKIHYETERLRALLGGYYFMRTNKDQSFFGRGILNRDARFEATTNTWAITGKLDFDVTSWLTVFAGLRYDNETFELLNYQDITLDNAVFYGWTQTECLAIAGAENCPFHLITDATSETSFSAFLPQAGLTVNWNDNVSTSLIWKKGYRPGGTDLKPGYQNDFDSEFTDNYEFSIRSSWFDDRLQVDANLYYTKWIDQQVLVFEFERFKGLPIGNIAHTENAGLSELYGYEIEVKSRPIDGLSLFANFGYSRTKFIEFDISGVLDLSGKEFQRAPRINASVGGAYRHQSGFFIGADYNYKSDSINSIARQDAEFEQERLPARAILNLKFGYEMEHASLYLYARNLLNEEYVTHRNTGPRLQHTVRVGEPRILGVQLTTSWF